MGLDMYLKGKYYMWNFGDNAKRHKTVQKTIQALLDTKHLPQQITFEIGYWRKANAIHGWFVENIQNGKDDCGEYFLDRSDLEALRKECKQVLEAKKDNEKCDLLEPKEGFFFGSCDKDEWYYEKIESTINIINEALKCPDDWDLYYESSW